MPASPVPAPAPALPAPGRAFSLIFSTIAGVDCARIEINRLKPVASPLTTVGIEISESTRRFHRNRHHLAADALHGDRRHAAAPQSACRTSA